MSARFLVVIGLITLACYAAHAVAAYTDAHAFPIGVLTVGAIM